MKLKDNDAQSLLKELDIYLLLTVRWGVIIAAIIIYLVSKPIRHMFIPPFLVLIVLVVFNFPIAFFIWNKKPYKGKHFLWIIVFDILQSSFAVITTGGYDSLFFVIYLLPFFEASVCFSWQMATAWIVSIDVVQLLVTGFHVITVETLSVSTYSLVSRFVRLLMVGFILILLGEVLRREDETRQNAIQSALNMEVLNDLFKELGGASLDVGKIFSVLIDRVRIIKGVIYVIVLAGELENDKWAVRATSHPDLYRVGESIKNIKFKDEETSIVRYRVYDRGISKVLFEGETKEIVVVNLFYHENNLDDEERFRDRGEEVFIFVIGRALFTLSANEEFFLKALALEARIALHNAYLFKKKQEQVRKLDKFREVQSTFFSAAGHQLKTPLTVLKTLLSSFQLTLENPSVTQKEILSTVQANVERLDGLISEILETARLETVDVVIGKKPVNIVQVITRVNEDMFPIASKRGQKITFRNFSSPFLTVVGDVKRIDEIISNIVSNALKFSPQGSEIIVSLRVKNRMGVICVHDEGPEIPNRYREKIFEKYYTAASEKALVGFGLGSYITKQLVELHGGNIWIEQDINGKSFCFSLPLYEGDYD